MRLLHLKNKTRTRTRLSLALTILFVLSLIKASTAVAAPIDYNVEIKVRGGYEDVARVSSSAPFFISLNNKGDPITGEVQVVADTGYESRSIYALPVELPKGSQKEITIDVPILTAGRKVEVRLVKGNKIIKSVPYAFNKLIPPNYPVIGILSDDPNALRELNGIKLPEDLSFVWAEDMPEKVKVMAAAGEAPVVPDVPVEIISLDKGMLPDEAKKIGCFDIIIISNFDTSVLTTKQIQALKNWTEQGGMLFIGTGPNARKIFSGLSHNITPFKIEGAKTIPMPQSIGDFIEKGIPQGDLNIVTGTAGDGSVILQNADLPLAVVYQKGEGYITLLTYDPSLSPFSGWDNSKILWQKLIIETDRQGKKDRAVQELDSYKRQFANYEHLASRVPETQAPPFKFLLIVVGIYIIIAGPCIYLFLKWRDKRDLNWLAVPAAALIFLGVIYIAGFKTRYTTGVLNSISIIKINNNSRNAVIDTVMGAFNNERGTLKLEYDNKSGFTVNPNQNYYDYYSYSSVSRDPNANARIAGKHTFGSNCISELYDVGMWEPRYIYASQNRPVSADIVSSVSINEGIFTAVIRNSTEFSFNEAFIVLGNNFIDVGDILPGEEKEVKVSLDDSSIKKRYNEFMDSRYGQTYSLTPDKRPPDWKEKYRKRNIIDTVYNSIRDIYVGENDGMKIMFLALNFNDPDYQLMINGKEPQKFHTNIIYSNIGISFEKGKKLEIPTGIIQPVLDKGDNVYFDDRAFSDGFRVQADGDVDFKFIIPGGISVEKIKVSWDTFISQDMRYLMQQQNNNTQQVYGNDTHEFFIYNTSTSQWEKFDNEFTVDKRVGDYIDENMEIKLRTSITLDKAGEQVQMVGVPEIEIRGVVK
jgi:hypothetical protein